MYNKSRVETHTYRYGEDKPISLHHKQNKKVSSEQSMWKYNLHYFKNIAFLWKIIIRFAKVLLKKQSSVQLALKISRVQPHDSSENAAKF